MLAPWAACAIWPPSKAMNSAKVLRTAAPGRFWPKKNSPGKLTALLLVFFRSIAACIAILGLGKDGISLCEDTASLCLYGNFTI
jgi:hypothetical protein